VVLEAFISISYPELYRGGGLASPVKKFSVGGIQVAIWENDGNEGRKFYSVSFDRRYKDKEGNWQSTTSLGANDLPKAILALQKAYEYVALKEPEVGSSGKAPSGDFKSASAEEFEF
jgi:hypothetical protein